MWFNSVIQSAGGSILNGPTSVGLGAPGAQGHRRSCTLRRRPRATRRCRPPRRTRRARPSRSDRHGVRAQLPVRLRLGPVQHHGQRPEGDSPGRRTRRSTRGGPNRAPDRRLQLGRRPHTKHPKQAFDAATCLASEQPERLYAQLDSLPPTLSKVYDDPEFKKSYPFADLVRKQIDSAGVRPSRRCTPTCRWPSTRRSHPRTSSSPRRRYQADRAPAERAGLQGAALMARAAMSDRTKAERKLGLMLCAPAVIMMLLVTAYPILYAIGSRCRRRTCASRPRAASSASTTTSRC